MKLVQDVLSLLVHMVHMLLTQNAKSMFQQAIAVQNNTEELAKGVLYQAVLNRLVQCPVWLLFDAKMVPAL